MTIIAAKEGLIYQGEPVPVGVRLVPPPGGSRLQTLLQFGWVADTDALEAVLPDVGLEPHEDGSPEQVLDESDVEETLAPEPDYFDDDGPSNEEIVSRGTEPEPEPEPEPKQRKTRGRHKAPTDDEQE